MYDISSLESFNNVERWLKELKSHSSRERDIVLLVVGNKKDLVDANPDLRQVTEEMAQELSTRLEVPVVEASAKSGEAVEDCFIGVTKSIYDQSYSDASSKSVLPADRALLPREGQSDHNGVDINSSVRKKKCC